MTKLIFASTHHEATPPIHHSLVYWWRNQLTWLTDRSIWWQYLFSLRRQYPQIYTTSDKLVIDPTKINISAVDFHSAYIKRTDLSQVRSLSQSDSVFPLLGEQSISILSVCTIVFPQAWSSVCQSQQEISRCLEREVRSKVEGDRNRDWQQSFANQWFSATKSGQQLHVTCACQTTRLGTEPSFLLLVSFPLLPLPICVMWLNRRRCNCQQFWWRIYMYSVINPALSNHPTIFATSRYLLWFSEHFMRHKIYGYFGTRLLLFLPNVLIRNPPFRRDVKWRIS